jgi:hypothetical protein
MNAQEYGSMRRFISLWFLLVWLGGLFGLGDNPIVLSTDKPPVPEIVEEKDDLAVKSAFYEAVDDRQEFVLGLLVYDMLVDNIRYSDDRMWAAVWLGYFDSEFREPLPAEPGLGLARRIDGQWVATFPSDQDWLDLLKAAPSSLIPEGEKETWLLMYDAHIVNLPAAALTGYLLPWPKGEIRYVSQTVGHDRYTPSGSAHFSFDFYKPGAMWNVYASKAGRVWRVKYDIPTCFEYHCGQSLGNYLVLEDTTTNPVSYQLYLHLAYDSVPPMLRTIGATVQQGQFIGVADNTGQSWGHHLHFHIHTYPSSYWGPAVDIVFDDVDINGGRPRVSPADPPYCLPTDVCHTFRTSYVSGNEVKGDLYPPIGDLLSPSMGDLVEQPTLFLAGWATDEGSGLYSAQLVANYGTGWKDIGPLFYSSPVVYEWDMCSADVPDGTVSVAMRLKDWGGLQTDLAGIKHFIKNYECALPPPCIPNPNQAALYKQTDYESCVLFEIGDYSGPSALGLLGDNTAASIRVGEQVQATLYSGSGFSGRAESFIGSDAGLQDNIIGIQTVSSLQVRLRSELPLAPLLIAPASGADFSLGDKVTLTWANTGSSVEYQVSLTFDQGNLPPLLSAWQPAPYLAYSGLEKGLYTYMVRSRNQAGIGPWSSTGSFSIIQPSPPLSAPVFTAPYFDNMENSQANWTKTGYWSLIDDLTQAKSPTKSWWYQTGDGHYDDGKPNFGWLTSPRIEIPTDGFFLRFWYQYYTEGDGNHWDQRWVQISENDGPFKNVLQLSGDPTGYWLNSPYLDLSDYIGKSIRIRFSFDTLDAENNLYKGWAIDDFSITLNAPEACQPSTNNSPFDAILIAYGETVTSEICPPGTVRYYSFVGSQGDRFVVDIDAWNDGSKLDPVVYLYDADGVSQLAMHDDEVLGSLFDPKLGYHLTRDGVYYLKVKAWDHPSAGGSDFFFKLHLLLDAEDPVAVIVSPATGAYIPKAPFQIIAAATDAISGIKMIEFYWHPSDWLTRGWVYLGADDKGDDGWSINFDPRSLPDQKGMAFFIRAYDWAGNSIGSGSWDLTLDRTPPTTGLLPLGAEQSSTAILLQWTGMDVTSGIAHFDIQWKIGSGEWQDYARITNPEARSLWAIGEPGKTYSFRMRGVDKAGNAEAYPSGAETTTSIPEVSVLCSTPDAWEIDNTPETAKSLPLNTPQLRNFCNPLEASKLNDADWLKINVKADQTYFIRARPQFAQAAVALKLFDTNGVTIIAEAFPNDFGEVTFLNWTSPSSGVYYLLAYHPDGRVVGNSVSYLLEIYEFYKNYLPAIMK